MLPEFIRDSSLLAGGWILTAIMVLSSIMWVLILDRYWLLERDSHALGDSVLFHWNERRSDNKLINSRLRSGLLTSFRQELSASVNTIQVITAVLPLLGLLGTVSGMIKTFEVMTVFGTGNIRGMADGISEALLTTMAGLLTALSGIYFATNLANRIEIETEILAERLGLEGNSHTGTRETKAGADR